MSKYIPYEQIISLLVNCRNIVTESNNLDEFKNIMLKRGQNVMNHLRDSIYMKTKTRHWQSMVLEVR